MIEINFPNAVRERDDLFGRDAQLDECVRTLRTRSPMPMVILGERLIGKTSLQQVIFRELEPTASLQFILLSPPPAHTLSAFAGELLDTLRTQIAAPAHMADLNARRLWDDGASQSEFLDAYRRLAALQPQALFVLCIDEFDSLILDCSPAERTPITNFVLHLIQHSQLPLVACFTMTSINERSSAWYPKRFLDKANTTILQPLSAAATASMVTALLGGGWEVTTDAQSRLYDLSGGHPYFTKLLLNSLIQMTTPGTRSTSPEFAARIVTASVVDVALDRAVESPEAGFALDNILNAQFTADEVDLMVRLASYGSRATLNGANGVTERLVQRGYLRILCGNDVAFRIGYWPVWLRAHRHAVGDSATPNEVAAAVVAPPLFTRMPSDLPAGGQVDGPLTLVVDENRGRTFQGEQELRLAPKEFSVLCCLAQRTGSVVTKDDLAECAWPDDNAEAVSDEAIHQTVARLRHKLEKLPHGNVYLETRVGAGYILHHARYVEAGRR